MSARQGERQGRQGRPRVRRAMSARVRLLMWVAVALAPLAIYPGIAWWVVSTGEQPAMTPYSPATWFAIALALAQLYLIRRTRARTDFSVNDTAFIMGLALTEAIAIEGFVLYISFGTIIGFTVMLLLALVGALLTRPT